jgi:uncharacterized membrane protein
MKKFRTFVHTSLLGGIVVILPVAVMFLVFRWIFGMVTGLISPFVRMLGLVLEIETRTQTVLAHFVVLAVIVAACFLVGVAVRTRLGGMAYKSIEKRVLRVAPGYSIIKETVTQLLGSRRMPFSTVALVRVAENLTVTAFVTESHPDGTHTVFVPTGPNPTTGFILHVTAEQIDIVKVPVEKVVRSIISCGVGSSALISAPRERPAPPVPTPGGSGTAA